MELLDSGKSQSQVATELGVTQSAVSKWASARRQGGQDGLKAKPHPGRPKKLTESQVKKLVKMLLESPRKHGFPTDLWTLARIAELIERKFDVSYDPSGVWHEWHCRDRNSFRPRILRCLAADQLLVVSSAGSGAFGV